jgi:hypothetical protein
MKVKMLETFQQVGATAVLASERITVSVLEAGETYEVDATLGAFLIENNKAEAAKAPHYGAQEKPEFRHDDVIYSEITGTVEVVEEETPESEEKPKARSKRGRK